MTAAICYAKPLSFHKKACFGLYIGKNVNNFYKFEVSNKINNFHKHQQLGFHITTKSLGSRRRKLDLTQMHPEHITQSKELLQVVHSSISSKQSLQESPLHLQPRHFSSLSQRFLQMLFLGSLMLQSCFRVRSPLHFRLVNSYRSLHQRQAQPAQAWIARVFRSAIKQNSSELQISQVLPLQKQVQHFPELQAESQNQFFSISSWQRRRLAGLLPWAASIRLWMWALKSAAICFR